MENGLNFARVGVPSTILYATLFLVLRGALGTYGANTLALSICSLGNIGAHRWLATRGQPGAHDDPRGRSGLVLGGVAGLATSLLLTTAALLVAERLGGGAWPASVIALALATACAGVIRFALLSTLAFRVVKRSGRCEEERES